MSGVGWRIGAVAVLLMAAIGGRAAGEMIASATDGSGNAVGYPTIEIWKATRTMELRQGDQVIGRFKIVLGTQPRDGKQRQGDGRTPVGHYYISNKKADTAFHRFLGISYPNVEDAERGYRSRLIGAGEWTDIFFANLRGDVPPSSTSLGGRVGIHGYGNRPYLPVDWTEGCIAVSNDDIEVLYERVPVGTPVIINE